ncbi:histidyl-tRNA synthetase [Synechococcus sp. PCC 7502]|uniref:histidine--tRNA ligase n=1 Tax=Synechococcus sp. PCC 7502 TaxID=1173263 RepID=UPI00029F8442|nr:histidine--tRNA ligase [Synechococcus sp. PCC 7502]AFY73257.1 histidyl-tRNA synthetase [Synechococcus sp. PCC 7502]
MSKNDEKINFKPPSGFDIEFLPAEKRLEQFLIDTMRRVFEQYGFTPIETPAVERLEVLQAKGNQGDNIIYSINPIVAEDGDKDSDRRGLKFDQTVPLAAYIARHLNDLTFPFARYQMDMVFRGERAKKGRYRQFRQCDIDVVGRGKLSLLYDAQIPAIIAQIFDDIKIGKFLIRINNRKVLTGFFQAIAITPDQIRTCLKVVDMLDKIGEAKVKLELEKQGISATQAQEIIGFTQIKGDTDSILDQLAQTSQALGNPTDFEQGISELKTVIAGVIALGVAADKFCIDLAIARGLEYYTGTVYETTLIGYESLGSICSGGRYEELVGMFVGEKMPGVGISIGLTRLLRQLMDAKVLKPLAPSPAQVMVLNLQPELIDTYLQVSQTLRQAGINVFTGFESRPIGKQFQLADKLGIPLCVIIGEAEIANKTCGLKNLQTGTQIAIALDDLVTELLAEIAIKH